MKKLSKLMAFLLCLCLILSCVSCSGDEAETEQKTTQKVYNTVFKAPTTVEPNSTTDVATTVEETEAEEIVDEVEVTQTKGRGGDRPVFEQVTDMRKISSKQLLSQLGNGITLGNSFTAKGLEEGSQVHDYETFFTKTTVKYELINAYKTAGFDIVRIPVCWSDHIDENGVVDTVWLDRIQKVVDYCMTNDLYCIINSQNDQNWLTTNAENFESTKARFSQMWTDIATRFAAYDDHLIFEGFAEILKAENDKSAPTKTDYKNANKLNQTFVDSVRATGGNNSKRHLVVSTYGAFVDSASLEGFVAPTDSAKNKLIAKVNIYIPSSFCLDESTDNMWGSNDDKIYLLSVFDAVKQRFEKLKIPVIIGEFGAVDKGNLSARGAYAGYFVNAAYNNYMVSFWNDNGQDMKIFDRAKCEIYAPNIVNSMIQATN